jgi:PAS domain S-box-containing protein
MGRAMKKADMKLSWEHIFDSISDLAMVLSPDHTIISVNQATLKAIGAEKDELIGRKCYTIFHSSDAPPAHCPHEALLNSTHPETQVMEMEAFGRPYLVTVSPIFDDAGILTGTVHISHDISARKEAEASLLQNATRWELALKAANQGFYDLTVQTGHAVVSDEYATMLGHDPAEFHETNAAWIERLHPDDREQVAGVYRRYIAAEISEYRVEFRQRTKSGGWKWILSIGKIVEWDEHGNPLRMLGTHTDITVRKDAEMALKESEQRYRTLVNNLPGVAYRCLYDEYWTMLFFSEGVERLTGYPMTDFINNSARSYASVIHPEDRVPVDQAVQSGITKRKPYEIEYRLVRADNNIIWVYEKGQGIFDSGGNLLWLDGVIVDITEQKRAQEERETLLMQLAQAQKMESIGRLAGGVAHDFNNMLAVILGYTELALDRVNPSETLHADLKTIEQAAKHSAELTRQLLAFARKQNVVPKVLDLNDTLEAMLKMLRRLIGEDIDLTWKPAPDLWLIRIDPSQIDQIMMNICVNARDAISGVGRITIETENIVVDESYCASSFECIPGNYVVLSISDTGCGMDRETINMIYDPFFTTKGIGKGTGLGLSTVLGIVTQNHGFINVYSEPGQGTTFKIYLPKFEGKTEYPGNTIDDQISKGHGEMVLLVEDDPMVMEMSKGMLQKLNYTVVSASSPEEAIKLAAEHAGKIVLLLTDVIMPEMNGKDLANKLRSSYPNLKCIFMSGYTADIVAHQGFLDEGVQFLQKPFTSVALAAKVHNALIKE